MEGFAIFWYLLVFVVLISNNLHVCLCIVHCFLLHYVCEMKAATDKLIKLSNSAIKRCTCVNKRKKKRKQVDDMKEYRQVPVAVEWVGDRIARVKASLQTKSCGPQRPPVEQPQPRCGRSAALVKRRSWVNIAVCLCLYSSLAYHRNINPFENKVWERYIFIKKCVRSFIEVRKLRLCFGLYMYVAIQHNVAGATKNICCAEIEGPVNPSTVSR